MPEDTRDTKPLDAVPEKPPGFDKLPVEDQTVIRQFQSNPDPVIGLAYVMTKVAQVSAHQTTVGLECADRHKVVDAKLRGFERLKWIGAGVLLVLSAIKAWVLTKVLGAP